MRGREKPAVWEERVEAQRRSGMTIKAYAAKIGVNPNTLSGWRWKLRRRAESSRQRMPRWMRGSTARGQIWHSVRQAGLLEECEFGVSEV